MSTQPDSTPQATTEAPDKGVGCDALFAALHRRVNGALKCAIDAHGPITKENHGSAGKRIAKQVAMLETTIRLERHDEIPAFGAFLRCEEQHDESPVIALNVQAVMCPDMEDDLGNTEAISREDRKRLIITTLMHEFGHALESHFRLPVNEEAIEKACEDWERAYSASNASQQRAD